MNLAVQNIANELRPVTQTADAGLRAKQEESRRMAAETEEFMARGGEIRRDMQGFAPVPWPMTDRQALRLTVSLAKVLVIYGVSRGRLMELRTHAGFPIAYMHQGELKFSAKDMAAFMVRQSFRSSGGLERAKSLPSSKATK